jgi:pyruvate formate lyase activating enzyme
MVNLMIPTLNDNPDEIKAMCQWIVANLGVDVPLHFTRFHPQYLLRNLPPTPVKTLETAHNIAREAGLHYVYIGNVPGHSGENTYCHNCHTELIVRRGFYVIKNQINQGRCPKCSTAIPGIWS